MVTVLLGLLLGVVVFGALAGIIDVIIMAIYGVLRMIFGIFQLEAKFVMWMMKLIFAPLKATVEVIDKKVNNKF